MLLEDEKVYMLTDRAKPAHVSLLGLVVSQDDNHTDVIPSIIVPSRIWYLATDVSAAGESWTANLAISSCSVLTALV